MFFLFSNNHLNDIIGLGYDLRDEEVLAHFVTLLKTISFKLNKDTIQFFFQVDAGNRCVWNALMCLCLPAAWAASSAAHVGSGECE